MRTIDQLIAETPIFDGLAPEHLELIAGCGWNERIPAGTRLLREGEAADRFYILRHGVIALEFEAPGRGPLVIETLHDGDVVGWSWLFTPYRWAMDGRAVEDCSVVTFDATCLRGKADADHELGYQLMSRFAQNVIERLQSTRMQLIDVYGRAPASA